MKTKYIIYMLVMYLSYGMCAQAVNLESISENKRNKYLLLIAKDVVLRYGPGYYRDDPKPIIEQATVSKNYVVKYLPKPEEKFEWGDAAIVFFDNATGMPTSVSFGNGLIKKTSDDYKSYIAQGYYGEKIKNGVEYKKPIEKETVVPIKYQTAILRKRVVETNNTSDSLSLRANPPIVSNDTNRIKRKIEYKGYYLSGKDTIKMYRIVKDTVKKE